VPCNGDHVPELKRTLGLWSAAAVSIGSIIGAGIFVLIGVASGYAGPAMILAFFVAGLASLFTALSAGELASFITESGGSYIYTHHAFGRFWGYIVGWMQTADYIIGASAVAIGFAAYFAYFLGITSTTLILIAVATALSLAVILLNVRGMQEAARTNALMVLLKIIALVIFIAVGGMYLFSHGTSGNYSPFFPNGIGGMLNGAAIIFFAFVGFNTVTVIAEEVISPEKNVPRALLVSFFVSLVLYLGVSSVSLGLLNWQILSTSAAPLEAAITIATSNILILKYISLAALFATASVVLSSLFGGSRAIFAMARQGVLPHRLATVSAASVPVNAVLVSGLVMIGIILASGGDLGTLAQIFNFGTLLTYFFINLSVIELRHKMPTTARPFKVPLYPITPFLGLLSCILLVAYLQRTALIFGVIWISFGVLLYEWSGRHNPPLPKS
jgi:APA family basic amino acid/polyamine antiporter